LLLASFAGLYFELLFIRWAPTTIHALGFFNNLVLIASFLGLGVGMSTKSGTGSAVWPAFFRVGVLTLLLTAALRIDLPVLIPASSATGFNEMMTEDRWIWVSLPVVLLAVFGLVVWAMVPFGRLIAEPFDQMERIPAYTVNVAGSLLGVLAFTLVSWLELSPFAWFAVGFALLWALERKAIYALPTALVLIALVLHQTNLEGGATTQVFWSPYYKVIVRPIVTDRLDDGFNIEVNHQFLLTGVDMSGRIQGGESQDPRLAKFITDEREYHELPFQLHQPQRVLILGAGVGNDVAVALRHGAKNVVAVEIDPVVIKLGQHHPEKPFADKQRVQVIYNDARAYLNNTEEKFDLILFATLDAHGLLSSVGNLRLDSFVYTQESLAAARRHLSDDGLLVLSFGPFREWTQYRQYSTIEDVFGRPPLNFSYKSGSRTLVAGAIDGLPTDRLTPGWRLVPIEESTAKLQEYPYSKTPATDDWPHLYIRDRSIPMEYIYVLSGILVISVVVVAVSFREGFRLDGHFFFMGAAFLLMETKGITELALLLGSTWQVNAVVFSVILLMILLANFLVLKWGKPWLVPIAFAILGTSLTIHYLWPTNRWASGLGSAGPWVAVASLGFPIFLAALIFATTFSGARLGSAALASNLLGSVFGGVTEFLSMVYGARFLSLLALIMYAAAFAFWLRYRSSPAAAVEKQEEPVPTPAPAVSG
jgi:hypothetical protein